MATAARSTVSATLAVAALLAAGCGGDVSPSGRASSAAPTGSAAATMSLPGPRLDGSLSVEEALARRRSVREYADAPLTLEQLSQLLWAAQGMTEPRRGLRTAPSAGALYPLEVYVAVERVDGVRAGVFRYAARGHRLELVLDHSVREQLYRDALSQSAVASAPVTLVLAAVYARTTVKYGERGRRYVAMEAGHAAQNVCLQAVALGLGTVVMGAFDDVAVKRTLGLRADEEPLYLMPVGRPRAQ
jgi:SagB-type dehydrogenase family enzyme